MKINNPRKYDQFPIEIKSYEEYKACKDYLYSKGYTWQRGNSLNVYIDADIKIESFLRNNKHIRIHLFYDGEEPKKIWWD